MPTPRMSPRPQLGSCPNWGIPGHLVTGDSNQTQETDIRVIQEAGVPRSKKELRRFLGICGWTREYISRYSQITATTNQLFEKRGPSLELDSRRKRGLTYTLQFRTSPVGISSMLFQVSEGLSGSIHRGPIGCLRGYLGGIGVGGTYLALSETYRFPTRCP